MRQSARALVISAAALSLAMSYGPLRAEEVTTLEIISPSQWFFVQSRLESARTQAVRLLDDRVIVLVRNEKQSEVLEFALSGNPIGSTIIDGRYAHLAVAPNGAMAMMSTSRFGKTLITILDSDRNVMNTIESPEVLKGVFYLSERLHAVGASTVFDLAEGGARHHIPFESAAGPLFSASDEGTVFLVDPITAECLRFEAKSGNLSRLKLYAPEVQHILSNRSAVSEAAIAAICPNHGGVLLGLIPRFKVHEGATVLKFSKDGSALSGYRLVLPRLGSGGAASQPYGAPWALSARGSRLILLMIQKNGPAAIGVYDM